MTSSEKMDILLDLDRRKSKARITTVRDEIYYCKPLHFAEDEDDWAYDFFSPDHPTHFFVIECSFIKRIEEISDEEWEQHLEQIKKTA